MALNSFTNGVAINIWQMAVDGLWSSSVVIAVYGSAAAGGFVEVALNVRVNTNQTSGACPDVGGFPLTSTIPGEPCPTHQIATITVFDDGSYVCTMR